MAAKIKRTEGKYMATVKVGPKGQIVIPKEVRSFFQLQTGDTLLLLADQDRGVALIPQSRYQEMLALFSQAFSSVFPPQDLS